MSDDVTIVICAPVTTPLYFADNELGQCSACQRGVQHRPHIPRPSRLMCFECAGRELPRETTLYVTPRTLAELEAYRRRN